MDGAAVALGEEMLDPPQRLYERLRHFAGYTWDEDRIFHSSYDNFTFSISLLSHLSANNIYRASFWDERRCA
jgi:hypothetical protein